MNRRRWWIALALLAAVTAASYAVLTYVRRQRTVADAVAIYGPAARTRLQPYFKRAHVLYPPRRLAFLVFKKERRLAVWARDDKSGWRFIRDYAVLAASGKSGPKLRQGDYQVPEGIYRIALLNPASSYHLSMLVGYPNEFDRAQAARDHRTNLGGDIYIHGKNLSIGCVAIGDTAIEELFTLAADTGIARIKAILAPNDLRIAGPPMEQATPLWIVRLWQSIGAALREFPIELESNSALGVVGRSKMAVTK
jgi:hypothetical protein